MHELYDNQTIYQRSKRYVEEPKFDVFLNPTKKEKQVDWNLLLHFFSSNIKLQQEETLKNLTKKFQEVFQSMDMKNSYPALFQVLWHSVNPCFDIQNWTSTYRDQKSTIKRCKWKGVDVSFAFVEK